MCFICNCSTPEDYTTSSMFLHTYQTTQQNMKKSSDTFLKAIQLCQDKNTKKRYDKLHKKMKRIIKDWNKIEHLRELENDPNQPSPSI